MKFMCLNAYKKNRQRRTVRMVTYCTPLYKIDKGYQTVSFKVSASAHHVGQGRMLTAIDCGHV